MLLCNFCGKECKNNRSLRSHERLCKENPNRQESGFVKTKDKHPWNFGLTKDTDDRVKANGLIIKESIRKLYDSGYRTPAQTTEYWTEERRKQKSEWRKQLHIDHPETHPNRRLSGNRNKMTYPEQIAFNWLTANNIVFEPQKRIDGKYVDFCIDQIIIEIDGERFHPIGNENDKLRDLHLSKLGYKVYRIRSKERIEDRLKDIFER